MLIIGSAPHSRTPGVNRHQNWGATAKMGTHNEGSYFLRPKSRVCPPTLGYARQHPLPRQSYQNRSHLVHKDIHRRIERDPGAGGHGQEAEPHAHVEPLADAGPVKQLRLLRRPGRVLRRLLRRLGAATWRLGGRSTGGPRSWRTLREARQGDPSVQPASEHPRDYQAAGD